MKTRPDFLSQERIPTTSLMTKAGPDEPAVVVAGSQRSQGRIATGNSVFRQSNFSIPGKKESRTKMLALRQN
jgi:hypothetical protein